MRLSDIATKIVATDDDGHITLAIKVTVENDTDDEEIYVTMQGLDRDGFVVHEITVGGEIPTGESKVLTEKDDYVKRVIYDQIGEWRAK